MVNIINYEEKMAAGLWDVFYTSIRMICIKHYSEAQVKAWAPDDFDQSIFKEKIDKINPYVAIINENVVGYADLQNDGLIDHFFVHGQYQRQGVGNALMEKILHEGTEKERLYSYVSHTAKPFYAGYGFIVEKIRQEEVRGSKIENNLMVRTKKF